MRSRCCRPGKGLRGARLGDHIRKGPAVGRAVRCGPWRPRSRAAAKAYEIGTGLAAGRRRRRAPAGASERRARAKLRRSRRNRADDCGSRPRWIACSSKVPADGGGFSTAWCWASMPAMRAAQLRYEHAMRERARLLKFGPRDPAWLDGLEAEMAETGVAMTRGRAQTVARLNAALADARSGRRFPLRATVAGGRRWRCWPKASATARLPHLKSMLAGARMRDAEIRRTTYWAASERSGRAPHGKAHGCARLLHGRAEGAADLHRAGRCVGTGAGARRLCAAAAARRSRGPSRCASAARPCSRKSSRLARRPG